VDWDDLRFVLAVARSRSIADAARTLGVAHSTVYRRIVAFENAHDVKLFERLPTGYEPLEVAVDLARIAESVEKTVAEAERRLLGHDRSLAGDVTLTAPEAFGPKLGSFLPELIATFPEITLSLKLTGELAKLELGEADIALRVAASPPPDLVGRRLAHVAFAIFAKQGETRDTSDPSLRWVVLDEQYAQSPQGRWEKANVPTERIAVRASGRMLFLQAVLSGVGVGLLPCGLADQEPSLMRLGAPLAELSAPLWILTHRDLKDVPRVRAVSDFLTNRIVAERDLLEGRGA
jgi:DNA-binding transcriptional LysR family regulator